MLEAATYGTVAMTLGLVLARPRIWRDTRLSPAISAIGGVCLLYLLGVVGPGVIHAAASELWRPLLAIASIMVMAEVAQRIGLLEWAARRVEAGSLSPRQLFTRVFLLGVITASILNNDAAILLLTPLVVILVRRRYPDRPDLILPFAFAVFMAAGVAPLVVSNPMNMVVAELSGIGFNWYATRMIPIAVVGWIISYFVLSRVFRSTLAGRTDTVSAGAAQPATGPQKYLLALLLAVLAAYSVVGYIGGPVWAVAACGAMAALLIAQGRTQTPVITIIHKGVSWDTLGFLLAVLILALGLREVGFVDRLLAHYSEAGTFMIGATSTVGSALLNNHPMAYMNVLALDPAGEEGRLRVLAALVGGDLGPRLLPIGSLAGLMWLELLRRQGVEIRLRRFITVGVLVTVPALLASLALLSIY